MDWANPGCLGSRESFAHRFSMPIERGLRFDALKGELATARKLLKKLEESRSLWVLRRTKDKTISGQLPKKVDQVVYCQPSKLQLAIFRAFHSSEEMRFLLRSTNVCDCGSKRQRYRCCHPTCGDDPEATFAALQFQFIHLFMKASNHVALLLPKNTGSAKQAAAGERFCAEALRKEGLLQGENRFSFETLSDPKYSGKMEVLVELLRALEDEEGAKVLLFSYSTTVLNILEAFVQSRGHGYLRLDGRTRTDVRQDLVDTFNADKDVFLFLISTKAGGLGLNITGANVVIVFDPNWNPSHDLQAQDRAYRIGQRRDVRVYRLITAGSIEENVYLRQIYKQQMSKSAVDGEKAARYFNAVLRHKKGELFGLRNMFTVREKRCLTNDIFKRKEAIEQVVKGKKAHYEVAENLLEYNSSNADEQTPTASFAAPSTKAAKEGAAFGLDLDNELDEGDEEDEDEPEVLTQWERKKPAKKSVGDVLKSDLVVHSHVNQDVVGRSRVEEHLSKVVLKQVAGKKADGALMADDDGLAAGMEPVLKNCGVIGEDTQAMTQQRQQQEEDTSDDDESSVAGEAVLGSWRRHLLKADSERMFRVSNGPWLR